jgi:5-methylcytosine-specific restriction endonuclease McrBC GTP-binding regulatory subunit McrB
MSVFDIFSFKKEAGKVFTKENFVHVMETAKNAIIEQAKDTTKKGVAKKFIVDEKVIKSINILKDSCKNGLIKWLLDRIVDIIPTVTQLIYEFLKEKIENL